MLALRATKQMAIPLYSRVHQLQFVAPLNFSEDLAEIQPSCLNSSSDIRRRSSLASLKRTHTPATETDEQETYPDALRDKVLMALKVLHCNGVRLPLHIRVFESPGSNFRMRGYFYVRWKDGSIEYHRGGSAPYRHRQHISMNQAMAQIQRFLPEFGLCHGIEEALFHVSSKRDVLVMLGYDKILPSSWASKARALHRRFGFHVVGSIIGRSWWARRQGRISVLRDHLLEQFDIQGTRLLYRQVIGFFSQPNYAVAHRMLEWAVNSTRILNASHDLMELYCGGGFFSVALARNFRKCIIADSSRELVQLARQNLELNEIRNVQALWMTAVNMLESWKSNSLPGLVSPNTLLVDPTRHGLDSAVTEILPAFENILYISCNPRTMARDLRTTTMTHDVKEFACFDQFPGTDHMECAALLTRDRKSVV